MMPRSSFSVTTSERLYLLARLLTFIPLRAVSIYSLSLDALTDRPYTLSPKSIPGPPEGRISVVELCDDIIATVVARIPSHLEPPTYTAVFYNIHSERKFFHQFSAEAVSVIDCAKYRVLIAFNSR